jgi:hypothetical protein
MYLTASERKKSSDLSSNCSTVVSEWGAILFGDQFGVSTHVESESKPFSTVVLDKPTTFTHVMSLTFQQRARIVSRRYLIGRPIGRLT